ncbi:hypothetical protein D3C78_1857610 [compost metagenome]
MLDQDIQARWREQPGDALVGRGKLTADLVPNVRQAAAGFKPVQGPGVHADFAGAVECK